MKGLKKKKKVNNDRMSKLCQEHFYSKEPVPDHRSEQKVAQNLRVTPVTINRKKLFLKY